MKVAILIDGGYFLKRLPAIRPFPADGHVEHIVYCLDRLVNGHLEKLNQTLSLPVSWAMLHRVMYYDAKPYSDNATRPVSKKNLNFGISDLAKQREALFAALRRKRMFALRLGHVYREGDWTLSHEALKSLLKGERQIADLTDDDFSLGLRQKGVDMRIGIDIASLAYKKQVEKIVLVAGDADFVPAAKLARREGIEFILDPMWRSVSPDLYEHIDGLWSGLSKQNNRPGDNEP
ncbi:MAG: NYN domain-containing protein [Magnetococcales bacterium]|nr:NYN domain-containing protein [Magnetococcales bacterium]